MPHRAALFYHPFPVYWAPLPLHPLSIFPCGAFLSEKPRKIFFAGKARTADGREQRTNPGGFLSFLFGSFSFPGKKRAHKKEPAGAAALQYDGGLGILKTTVRGRKAGARRGSSATICAARCWTRACRTRRSVPVEWEGIRVTQQGGLHPACASCLMGGDACNPAGVPHPGLRAMVDRAFFLFPKEKKERGKQGKAGTFGMNCPMVFAHFLSRQTGSE